MHDAGGRLEARLLREKILRRVRELAGKGKVSWSDHSFDRMEERGIDLLTAKRVLDRGEIKGDPSAGENADEWIVTIVDEGKPNRDIGVVTVVIGTERLLVITVEWEDL